MADPQMPHRALAVASRQDLDSGHTIVYWTASSRAETEAFLRTLPEGQVPPEGVVCLFHAGQTRQISLKDLMSQKHLSFEGTGLRVDFNQFNPRFLGLVLDTQPAAGNGTPSSALPTETRLERLILFAEMVEFNRYSDFYGLYGAFWLESLAGSGNSPTAEVRTTSESSGRTARQRERAPGQEIPEGSGDGDNSSREGLPQTARSRPLRVDILQGVDGLLYYRAWHPSMGVERGILPADGTTVRLYAEKPLELEMAVSEFVPSDRPGELLRPEPFQAGSRSAVRQPFARVRLTVEGFEEEFWLEAVPASPFLDSEEQQRQRFVVSRGANGGGGLASPGAGAWVPGKTARI